MEKLFVVTATLRLIVRAEHPGEAIDAALDALSDLPDANMILMISTNRANMLAQLDAMTHAERDAVEHWLEMNP